MIALDDGQKSPVRKGTRGDLAALGGRMGGRARVQHG